MDTLEQISLETRSAVEELLDAAGMKAGDLLVVGCSSSEVCGGTIGHASSPETGKVIAQVPAAGTKVYSHCQILVTGQDAFDSYTDILK